MKWKDEFGSWTATPLHPEDAPSEGWKTRTLPTWTLSKKKKKKGAVGVLFLCSSALQQQWALSVWHESKRRTTRLLDRLAWAAPTIQLSWDTFRVTHTHTQILCWDLCLCPRADSILLFRVHIQNKWKSSCSCVLMDGNDNSISYFFQHQSWLLA